MRRGLELVGIVLIVACIIGIVVLTTMPQCTDDDRNALVCLNLRSGRPAPVAPTALTPGTAPTVSSPAPAPQEEASPIVAAAPGALMPGTAPTVSSPAPAPQEEAAPIVAAAPGALMPGRAPTVSSPAPAALPVEPGASTVEISALLARGDSLFGVGDVASARLFYERATNAGDAQAALKLGETYDPLFLARARLNGVRGDLAAATRWYRRARDLGSSDADILLKSVENR